MTIMNGKVQRAMLLVLMAAVVGGCASSRTAQIHSTPEAVQVSVNGAEIGTTPITHTFTFTDSITQYNIMGAKQGYHPATTVVTENQLAGTGMVTLDLEPQNRTIALTSTPSQASVRIGNQNIDLTPTEYVFDFANRSRRYSITFSREGYFDETISIGENSNAVRSGIVRALLEEDPAWTTTTQSEATNKWLRIPVDPTISAEDAWQKVIDSVTSVYDSLEQLDQTSGYLRSTSRVREFARGPEGPFLVRTQLIGSISTTNPLTYKFKLVATKRLKKDSSEHWKEFGRVFREDAFLVEELLGRLGLK